MACEVLILGHGTLPEDLLRTAEMICGPAEGVATIGLPPGQDMEEYRQAVRERLEAGKDRGLLILVDLKGGTPFLTASRLMMDCWDGQIELVTGLNLPMLTEVLSSLDEGLDAQALARCAAESGAGGVVDFRKAMKKRHQEESA